MLSQGKSFALVCSHLYLTQRETSLRLNLTRVFRIFGEADVTLSHHEEDVSAFTEKLWNKRDAGRRTVLPPPCLLLVLVHKSRMK